MMDPATEPPLRADSVQFREPSSPNESGDFPLLESEPPDRLAIVPYSANGSGLTDIAFRESNIGMASASPDPIPQVVDVTAVQLASEAINVNPLDRLEATAFPDNSQKGIGLYTTAIAAAAALPSADREAYLDGVLSLEGACVTEEQRLASASAVAKCDLIDALSNEPLTPRREALWNRLLDDGLTPGPFADYLFKAIKTVDISDSCIRSSLSDIHAEWTDRYGDDALYARDLERLADVLDPRQRSPFQLLERAFTSLLPRLGVNGEKTEALLQLYLLRF